MILHLKFRTSSTSKGGRHKSSQTNRKVVIYTTEVLLFALVCVSIKTSHYFLLCY